LKWHVFFLLLDLRKIAHLSKPKTSEIKSLFSTGSVFVDTLTGEKGILATWGGLGGVVGLRKFSKAILELLFIPRGINIMIRIIKKLVGEKLKEYFFV